MLSSNWRISVKPVYKPFFSSFVTYPFMHIFTLLIMGLLFLSLVSCASNAVQQVTQVTPSPIVQQVTPTPVPEERVLYQADWSKGFADWKASSGWQVKNGFIESNLDNPLSMVLPYHISVVNYAIEFSLQVVSVPKDGGQFQLVADRQQGKDGYSADVLNLLTPGNHAVSIHPLAEVITNPADSMGNPLHIIDYEPRDQYVLYRVEVNGARVDFRARGNIVSRAITTRTVNLSNGPIRLLSRAAILRVRSFRVLAI